MRAAIAGLLSRAAILMGATGLTETKQSMAVKAAAVAADAKGVTMNAAQLMMLSWGVIPFTRPEGFRSGSYTKRGPGHRHRQG